MRIHGQRANGFWPVLARSWRNMNRYCLGRSRTIVKVALLAVLSIPLLYLLHGRWKTLSPEMTGILSEANHVDIRCKSSAAAMKNEAVEFESDRQKVVLYWTRANSVENFYLGLGDRLFDKCPFSNCVTTTNRSVLLQASAVLFHGPNLKRMSHMPQCRPPGQLWVFANRESPVHIPIRFGVMHGMFNVSMTYRSDSDIVWNYVRVLEVDGAPSALDRSVSAVSVTRRRGLIAWVVSNCRPASRRVLLVQQLRRYVDVDVYGRCAHNKTHLLCPPGRTDFSRDACFEFLGKNYMFYLSLENSLCEDYITEKLYFPLKYGLVPVVLGASQRQYATAAPPGSFIHVDQFVSVRQLADYLKSLRNTLDVYAVYQAWRRTHRVVFPTAATLCRLCALLHEKIPLLLRDNRVADWWNDPDSCGRDPSSSYWYHEAQRTGNVTLIK